MYIVYIMYNHYTSMINGKLSTLIWLFSTLSHLLQGYHIVCSPFSTNLRLIMVLPVCTLINLSGHVLSLSQRKVVLLYIYFCILHSFKPMGKLAV